MSRKRYEHRVDRRPVAQPPLAAYRSLLVRIAGAVLVGGLLTWLVPKSPWFYRLPMDPPVSSEEVWGVEVVQPIFVFLFDFFVSRVTSPFVLGPVVVAGVLALAFEYRRRRSAR
ncbi:hypothetical protein SAMN05216559_3028 [Halomicrobium zhouii]|uniref:Uncharacterized protein n=1 Tax=Halomicrobium zhouii TaxID=767519 RepID=A0A1I6LSJ6_9EURY|nr:hypothetical protein [Halomicrobium zhouii]SFS06388.1 hypothetical protein SAMN05216559_3028 [Halomicrobium zhouii]